MLFGKLWHMVNTRTFRISCYVWKGQKVVSWYQSSFCALIRIMNKDQAGLLHLNIPLGVLLYEGYCSVSAASELQPILNNM